MTMTRIFSVALLSLWLAVLAGPAHSASDWLTIANQLGGSSTDFTPHGTQPGLMYGLEKSDTCGGCHGASGGIPTSTEFRPHTTWAGSMMANAMRDPLFLAALDVANNDLPGVGDFCLRCHTSDGWYGGRVVKAGFGATNDVTQGAAACLLEGSYDAPDFYGDYGGLSCHFCHRLMPEGPLGQPTAGNGAAWLDDQACASGGGSGPCRRGPYNYTSGGAPHEWKYSPYHESSAICGQCHDVTSPDTGSGPLKTLKLADGTDTGMAYPIERTFTEWQRSAFSNPVSGQDCQGCHMPDSQDPEATACILGGYPNRTGDLPTHQFAGGNTWIPRVLKGEYSDTSHIPGSWQGIGREESFDQTVEWARHMLQGAATVEATLGSYVAPTPSTAGSLAATVKVTNQGGHKLPSGYGEGRRMWLNVVVRDANGAVVAESGAYDAASAHLQVDAQARVYEVLQGIHNHNGTGQCDVLNGAGKPMFHFVLNDCIAKDNRIPPLGFKPVTAADPQGYEVRPVGITYPETAPGSGVLVNFDQVSYSFAVPAGTATPLGVTARLYYQTASRDYIEFLRREAVENQIPGENQMCMGQDNRPFVVGPKDRTRGQYMFDLWNEPEPHERIFGNGFDATPLPTGYGKSPPELMQTATVLSP